MDRYSAHNFRPSKESPHALYDEQFVHGDSVTVLHRVRSFPSQRHTSIIDFHLILTCNSGRNSRGYYGTNEKPAEVGR